MRMHAVVALAAGCGSSPTPSPPAPPKPPPAPAFDRQALDDWFDRVIVPKVPSAVVGVVIGDELVWHRGGGSRDARGGPPPDRSSMFRIGSITKVLTGIAVMQLRDRGVVELDAPVARWVPELAARLAPAGGTAVTLRHLVTHTSGIPSIGDGSAPYWVQAPPTDAAMLKALDAPLTFAPGTQAAYSNAGMALAGLVVARAAKRSYRDYLATEVIGPLGMAAAWDAAAIDPAVRVTGRGNDGKIDPPTWQLGAFEPAGGLWASLDHMVALARFTLGRPGADRVLGAASRRAMTTDDPLPGQHGVAWLVGPGGVGHAGSTTDFSASIVVAVDDNLAGIALTAGADVELPDCVAVGAVRAIVKGTPLPSCDKPAVKPIDPGLLTAACDRLLAFLKRPDVRGAEATFAPSFLAVLPAATLLEVTKQLDALAGACTSYTIATPGAATGQIVFSCAKGKLRMAYVLDGESPSRFIGLQALGVE